MGSVLALTVVLSLDAAWLPRRLRHARHETVVGHLSQADPAQAELAIDGAGPAAAAATAVLPGRELRGSCLANPLGRLGHLSRCLLPLRFRQRVPRPASRRPPGSPP